MEYCPAPDVGWVGVVGGAIGQGGWDNEALTDHKMKRTSGAAHCFSWRTWLVGRSGVEGRWDQGVKVAGLCVGGCQTPPSMSYRSISSSSGVASPAMDMGVLSIMGLGDGRGVIL